MKQEHKELFEDISDKCGIDFKIIKNTYESKQLNYIGRDLHLKKEIADNILKGVYADRAYQVMFDYSWKHLGYEPSKMFM